MSVIGSLAVNVVANTGGLQRGLTRSRSLINGFSTAATALLPAVGGAVVGLTKTYENFNKSMMRATAIMDNVSSTMRNEMTEAALKVSKTTQFAAHEAADAFKYLASAGLDAEQSLKSMPIVANFAQAGNFNLAGATDMLVDSVSALGMKSSDTAEQMAAMNRVADNLVKGNIISNTSTEDLAKALTNKAAAAARLVGKEVEETVAVLSVFADQGLKGAAAGDAFNIVMRDMQTKALQNAAAFRSFGVRVFDAGGEMNNMADIVRDVERALGGMSAAQKKATLLTLGFTDKSISFVQTLLGTSDKIRDYESALRSAGGAAEQIASQSLTALEKATNRMRGAWEGLAITVGPFFAQTAADVMEWAAGFDALTGSGSRVEAIMGTLADVVHTVKLGFTGAQFAVTELITTAVEGITTLSNATADILNSLPGVNVEKSGFLNTAAEDLRRSSDQLRENFNKALMDKTPSERMRAMADQIERTADNAKKVGEAMKSIQPPPALTAFLDRMSGFNPTAAAESLFRGIGGGVVKAQDAALGAASMAGSALASVGTGQLGERRHNAFVEMGSREAFDAVRRHDGDSGRSREPINEVARHTKGAVGVLEKILAAIEGGAETGAATVREYGLI